MFEYMKNVMMDFINITSDILILAVLLIILAGIAIVAVLMNWLTSRQEKILFHIFIGMSLGIVLYGLLSYIISVTSPSNTPKNVTYDRNSIHEQVIQQEPTKKVKDLTPVISTDEQRAERFDDLVTR